MRFTEWIAAQPHGTRMRLVRAGLSPHAVRRASTGQRVGGRNAELLSAATEGAVSIEELVAPQRGES